MFRSCVHRHSAYFVRPSVRAAQLHTSRASQNVSPEARHNVPQPQVMPSRPKPKRKVEGRPHIVLGHRPGEEAKWAKCELGRILITEEKLLSPEADPSVVHVSPGPIAMPQYLNFGVGEEQKKLLFDILPALSIKTTVETSQKRQPSPPINPGYDTTGARAEQKELFKSSQFAKALDLRNANARGIAYENRKRCVAAFSTHQKPHDPGRPEVQAAILTMRIRNLWEHLMKRKKDVGNRRGLRKLVHKRAKILKYLKSLDRQRYDNILPRLGLEPGSVEGELTL